MGGSKTKRQLRQGAPTRLLRILAQDPTVIVKDRILTVEAAVPEEELGPGPRGYRVFVVDFDATSGSLYAPATAPVENKSVAKLIGDPVFHAQNVYAIVMRTLARFEFALGRRLSWSFDGHQIHVAPHAFADANAFYSKRDRGLFFGYFKNAENKTVFTCLSHDVVAHETTHALLDGLRERYTFPSSPDQAAFHEGFADAVALLSIFSLPGVVAELLDATAPKSDPLFVNTKFLTKDALRLTALFGLGEEMDPRRGALRRSVTIKPNKALLQQPEYLEPHNRGEIFVAAMMNAFLELWLARIATLGDGTEDRFQRTKVADEGQAAADHLLTMAIRAIDYAPVTDLLFEDYLTALLTADLATQPDDSKHGYRKTITHSFASYGIKGPLSSTLVDDVPVWRHPTKDLDYSKTHFDSMVKDRDEVFKFIWANREALEICEDAYTRVQSVRPCVRLSPDGFLVHETIAEYVQILNLSAGELKKFGIQVPVGMPGHTQLTLYGGGALIFDEYGRLTYHVQTHILDKEHQANRLQYLWKSGFFESEDQGPRTFSEMHRLRLMGGVRHPSAHEHDEYF